MSPEAYARSGMYAALSLAFRPPQAAPDDRENGSLADLLLQTAGELDSGLNALAEKAVDALHVEAGQNGEALRALEIAYNRLFVGPGRPLAPPYESLYRDPGGLVMGPSAQAVQACYAEAGIALGPDYHDLPDHVAAELGFMAYLTVEEAEAEDGQAGRWRERQSAFLRQHLAAWLPAFCERVRAAGQHPFYPAVADLAQAFVSWDCARLSIHRGAEDE